MAIQPVSIQRIDAHGRGLVKDHLAIEEPLEISLAWVVDDQIKQKNISITMRTPGQDGELALGFLFTEGILKPDQEVASVSVNPFDQKVLVSLQEGESPDISRLDRNFYMTSSCGVCGKTSIDAVFSHDIPKLEAGIPKVKYDLIQSLPERLRQAQDVFEQTGGLHAAGLFRPNGELVSLQEDIGRHNAVDKVIGTAFKQKLLPLNNSILLLSGRAGFELVQKSAMAGIPVLAAVGAPSSLAVQLAEQAGMTLLGFVKKSGFNIYTNIERVE